MKVVRLVFYFAMLVAISHVTGILSFAKQDKAFCTSSSSDEKETPTEEDESKESDDDKDFFFESHVAFLPLKITSSAFTSSKHIAFASPALAIFSPPPLH